MQNTTITKVNQKGQVVIPASVRKNLGITKDTFLSIIQYGQSVVIRPVSRLEYLNQTDNQIKLEMLKQTQGAWGKVTTSTKQAQQKRRLLEKKKTKKLKQLTW